MPESHLRQSIAQVLQHFATGDLTNCGLALFQALGYRTDKRLDDEDTSPEGFLAAFNGEERLDRIKAQVEEWRSINLLFQVTKDEIVQGNQLRLDFGKNNCFDGAVIESYLFLGLELGGVSYSRSHLATMTRELNKLFAMPVMVLFRYGSLITLAVINRRLNKRDESLDVLEKVTLIKDVAVVSPHRAHVEILFDLSLEQLYKNHKFSNFVELHRAWQKTLDSSELNKRFFKELADWYFWATDLMRFPDGALKDSEGKDSPSVIRMITRLIFVWFLKEKGLVPDGLFRLGEVRRLIHFEGGDESSYYKAILQNLFFATLNQEMNTSLKPENRKFRGKSGGRDQHYGIANVYRYEALFQEPGEALRLFETVPFLNGGLFECLDNTDLKLRVDGFSDRPDNQLYVPNQLFFSEERSVDLNSIYGTKNKKYKVRGLIDILNRYKFTIAENTPLEEEIALDPELLGKVFENLLASYNEETKATARKQTGSFYTPREVVDYMVDESLKVYLENALGASEDVEMRLLQLLDYNAEGHDFSNAEVNQLIGAIDLLKMLDPAVGSGAFPMGILQKLVFLLGKLDPQNQRWRDAQIATAEGIEDIEAREKAIEGIYEAFGRNELDYGRKLFLIQNCVYGVDIQPIAVQIAKLRFFISLIVEQRISEDLPNRGIRPLPNLETKFVAANTLMGLEDEGSFTLKTEEIERKEKMLRQVRQGHFSARSQATKRKRRDEDKQLRDDIGKLLVGLGFPGQTATRLSKWDPYDQNLSADFFDAEWMFGVQDGFDVVIGNPPYVRQESIKHLKDELKRRFSCFTGTADLYVYFYERGLNLLKTGGVLTFISSNKYFRAAYGQKLRQFLAVQSSIHQIIDFGDAPVFTAIAYPTILITEKTQPKEVQFRALNWEIGQPLEQFRAVLERDSFWMVQKELRSDGWQLANDAALGLLERLRKAGTPLGEYVKGRFYYGIKTGFNEAFVVDRPTRDRLIAEHPSSEEVLKPFLRGRDVKRWKVDYQDLWLLFIPWHFPLHDALGIEGVSEKAEEAFQKQYPAIYKHLLQFKKELSDRNRAETGIRYEWYALQRCAATYCQEFEKPKILYQEIATYQAFAWDNSGAFSNNKTFLIPDAEPFLLALLNSKVVWFFLDKTVVKMAGGAYAMQSIYLSQVPIPEASDADKAAIAILVQKCLDAQGKDVAVWEAEIDAIVGRLYGLSGVDLAIIQG